MLNLLPIWSDNVEIGRFSRRIEELNNLVKDVSLSDNEDSWCWNGDSSGIFSVKSMRSIIDNVQNSPFAGLAMWNKWLPNKVNCFVWRLLLNRIPTRSNICARGISLPSELCPVCNSNPETVDHLFYGCAVINEIWQWLLQWCDISISTQNSLEQLIFEIKDHGKTENSQRFLEAAMGSVSWFIWKARNDVIFKGKSFCASGVIVEIQTSLFAWIKFRSNCKTILWQSWCCNPLVLF